MENCFESDIAKVIQWGNHFKSDAGVAECKKLIFQKIPGYIGEYQTIKKVILA